MEERRRSIVREHGFERELRSLIREALAADEFVEGAEFLLSGDPECGTVADEGPPEVWVMPMAPVGNRSVWLFYSFDETTVRFLSIRAFAD